MICNIYSKYFFLGDGQSDCETINGYWYLVPEIMKKEDYLIEVELIKQIN